MTAMSSASWAVVFALTFGAGLVALALWRVAERVSPPDEAVPVEVDRFTVGPRVTVRARFACGCERWLDVPAAIATYGIVTERCPVHRTRAVHIEREEAA